MNLFRRTWVVSALGAVLALAAGPQAAAAPGAKTRLVAGMVLEPTSLDPTTAAAAAIGEVVHLNVFEGLTKINENGTVTPLLAQSWTMDPDGRSYTFRLRQGVRFHDGAPFDASAVKFSFERARAEGSTNKAKKALFDNISGIATPDPLTVILTLDKADGQTLFRLGEATAVILHPASAALAATQPVGTGPFRFESWKKGSSVTLVKFPGYRNAAAVALERVTFRFINDPAAQSAALLAGDVDVFYNIANSSIKPLQRNARYQVLIGAASGKGQLSINNRRAPLNDVRVRRAIMHAIDRQAFITGVLDGYAQPIGSHFAPADAGYIDLTGVTPYDPARARALLAEAGVKTPLALTLTLPPPQYARKGGEVVAAQLAAVGIEAKIENVEWAQWLSGAFKGNFDLTIINHVEPLDYMVYTDPKYYFGYDSAAFRALAAQHAAAANAKQRERLFADMQRLLAADAVNAWIFNPQYPTVARQGLKGLWTNAPVFSHDLSALHWE